MAKFGESNVWEMGWHPTSDGLSTRNPGVQLDIASGIDSLIFKMLGMENISKRNAEMFNWTAEEFVTRIEKQGVTAPEKIT